MKRREVQSILPIKPKKKGKVLTVQVEGNHLILDRWEEKEYVGRYCMVCDTGEHEVYGEKKGTWSQCKLFYLLEYQRYGTYYCKGYYDVKRDFLLEGEVEEAKEAIKEITPYSCDDLIAAINRVEEEYSKKKREQTEDRRQQKIKELMRKVPELPAGFKEWVIEVSGNDVHYAILDKEKRTYHCTACGGVSEEHEFPEKIGHNKKALCPKCRAEAIVNKRKKNGIIERRERCVILQNVDENLSAARHFDVWIDWGNGKRIVRLCESERLLIYRNDKKRISRVFYAQTYSDYEGDDWDDKRNPYNRTCGQGYLYPGGISEALYNTEYQPVVRVLQMMAAAKEKLDYSRLMCMAFGEHTSEIMEYLYKGRYYRLFRETADEISYYWGRNSRLSHLDSQGTSLEEILQIDRQKAYRLRNADGGQSMLLWLRWSEKNRKKISDEVISWMEQEKISPSALRSILERMSPEQIKNYLIRQKKQYAWKTAREVLEQWQDYLRMCGERNKDLEDEMIYRPRELKRRHNELVEEIRQEQAIELMKQNQKASKERAEKMRKEYPMAEQILEAIRPKYEYANEEYQIIVPKDLMEISMEGYALHHCVGSSERYFERIERQETYICFLRRIEKPDTPFYTIEIEPGGTIRQHRSYYDEEPGIEEIRAFLREWQQEVKKRISKEDRELAKESRKLREENIKELQEKNNTRVLLGLMEDFLDADIA